MNLYNDFFTWIEKEFQQLGDKIQIKSLNIVSYGNEST